MDGTGLSVSETHRFSPKLGFFSYGGPGSTFGYKVMKVLYDLLLILEECNCTEQKLGLTKWVELFKKLGVSHNLLRTDIGFEFRCEFPPSRWDNYYKSSYTDPKFSVKVFFSLFLRNSVSPFGGSVQDTDPG